MIRTFVDLFSAMKRTAMVALGVLVMGGCAGVVLGAAGGAATYAVVTGTLTKTVTAEVNDVYSATTAAMKTLEFSVEATRKDGVFAEVEAKNAKEEAVKVKIEVKDEGTRISIRVGTFGNEAVSRRILAEIEKGLPKAPA